MRNVNETSNEFQWLKEQVKIIKWFQEINMLIKSKNNKQWYKRT